MKNKNLVKIILITFLIFDNKFIYGYNNLTHNGNSSESPIYTTDSSYSIDQTLAAKGYSLKNEHDKVFLQYKKENISMAQFYATSLGPDEAIKLYLVLRDTIKHADIFINENRLSQKTDNIGMAVIDKYFKKGKMGLKITDNKNKHSLTYYFDLDKDLKLFCDGTIQLSCHKEYY